MASTGTQSALDLRFGVARTNPKNADPKLVRRVESAAQALAASMQAAKLKQSYVAAALGVHEGTVSKWASGKRDIPRKWVPRLCSITGTNLLQQHLDLEEALTGRDPIAYLAAQLQVAA